MSSGVRSGSACPGPAAMRRSLHYWALRRSGCPGCGIAASPLCGQRYAPTPLSGGGRGRISRPLTMIVSAAGAAPNAGDRPGSRAWSRSPGACRAKRSSFPADHFEDSEWLNLKPVTRTGRSRPGHATLVVPGPAPGCRRAGRPAAGIWTGARCARAHCRQSCGLRRRRSFPARRAAALLRHPRR